MKLSPYPKYKPSGIEWLGELPEGWSVDRLKRMSMRVTDGAHISPDLSSADYPFVSTVDISDGNIDVVSCLWTAKESFEYLAHTGCQPKYGDVLFSKDGTVGRTAVVRTGVEFVVASSLVIISPRVAMLDSQFLEYWLNDSLLQQNILLQLAGAALRRISVEKVARLPVVLPMFKEQRAIANFLDHKTAKIDTLVAKKRALIERMKEKRTALISRTVTRGLPPDAARQAGLDPHPKLKPSGVEWIGEVPEHWEMKQFRNVIRRLDQGWSPVAASWPAGHGEWGVLKLSAARDGHFHASENKALYDEFEASGMATPRAGNLLISRANTPDRVGDVALVDVNCPRLLIPDLLYRVELRRDLAEPRFMCSFLLSTNARARIEADARGSSGSMVKLGQGHVRAWPIPCPPAAEQRAIADYLDRETAKIDALLSKVETAIDRLREYRSALITAAVTGKIDVREAVA